MNKSPDNPDWYLIKLYSNVANFIEKFTLFIDSGFPFRELQERNYNNCGGYIRAPWLELLDHTKWAAERLLKPHEESSEDEDAAPKSGTIDIRHVFGHDRLRQQVLCALADGVVPLHLFGQTRSSCSSCCHRMVAIDCS